MRGANLQSQWNDLTECAHDVSNITEETGIWRDEIASQPGKGTLYADKTIYFTVAELNTKEEELLKADSGKLKYSFVTEAEASALTCAKKITRYAFRNSLLIFIVRNCIKLG